MGPNSRLIHLKAGRETTIQKLDVYRSLPEFIHNLEKFWAEKNLTYDILFSHYWLSALVGKYIQQKFGIPYIAMYHTLGAVKNAIGIGNGEPLLRINAEEETIRDCRKIIVATDKEKQDITLYYDALPEKVDVVPCGVNMGLFIHHDKTVARQKLGLKDDKIILFVGRIDPLKGIDQLLKAFTLMKNQHGLRLIIIGGDAGSRVEMENLQKISRELNISDRVIFQGLVKQDILPYYYSAADVCVIPSYYESFGLVPLESLACGTPVVATDVGDLKNIIRQGETGYIIPDNSPEKLAAAITLMLDSQPPDEESALAIRASVSRWDWANVANKVAGRMQSVLDGWLTPVV
jgi:D-inositol-3-phosphate glycosyltransferase